MAIKAPSSIDVTEYQFKLRSKLPILSSSAENKSNINLLATASNYGLVFVGDPERAELKVIRTQNLVDTTEKEEQLMARVVQLPSIPHCIGVSCDGASLAVNYCINGSSFISFYSVPAFLSGKVMAKLNIRVSPEENIQVLQILWNPVIPSMLAIVLDNGSLGMYNLKETGFEFHSIDKQEGVKCACWSPKGKQIVIGFPGGKLVQYKPDLKIARIIACPENIHGGPFNTIAVQWLSNFQFAVVFLQEGQDMSPDLYIVNAPKVGNSSYINYHDVSYGQCGPRIVQVFLIHIQPWNILLMTTSNSMEAGILGTKEAGDNPTWIQYTTLDEARLELPLTGDKQDTFPIGFCFETGCTHQVTVGENKIPVMPMIHVLSTHGLLISYDFLNLTPNAPGICSPPNAIADMSGINMFKSMNEILGAQAHQPEQRTSSMQQQQVSDITFSVPSGATSTPATDRKSKPIFGENTLTSSFGAFASATTSAPPIASFASVPASSATVSSIAKPTASFGGLFGSALAQTNQATTAASAPTATQPFASKNLLSQFGAPNVVVGTPPGIGHALAPSKSTIFGATENSTGGNTLVQKPSTNEKSKPLFTIPSTYTSLGQQHQNPQHQYPQQLHPQQQQQSQLTPLQEPKHEEIRTSVSNDPAIHDIIKQLIATQIDSFQTELKERSKDIDISIGNMDDSRMCTKKLNNLQEISDRAAEKDIEFDIQILRHSLSEAFSMIAEVKSKLNFYKNPMLPELAGASSLNQTNRRQMAKLKNLVAVNEAQLQLVQQQIDAQWASYQDLVRQNARRKLHVPGLEAIYQTLTKQEDILAKQRVKIEYIKSKLGVRGILNMKNNAKSDINVESLADSILSMSLVDQVKTETSRLTEDKRNAIKGCLNGKKIIIIKPQRPDRVGMNSEVILETKLRAVRQRDGAATKPEKMEKMRIQAEQNAIAKPLATKPFVNMMGSAPSLQQIKKVEPKPIILSQPQVQSFSQKPVLAPAKAPIVIGSSDLQSNSQPVNIFAGAPLGKLPFPSSSTGFLSGTQSTIPFSLKGDQNNLPVSTTPGDIMIYHPAVEENTEEKAKITKVITAFKSGEAEMESKEKISNPFTPSVTSGESRVGISLGGSAFSFSSRSKDNLLGDKIAEAKTLQTKPETATDAHITVLGTGSTKSESYVLSEKNTDNNKDKAQSGVGSPAPHPEPFSLNFGPQTTISFGVKSTQPIASSASGGAIPISSSTSAASGFSFATATPQPVGTFNFSKAADNTGVSVTVVSTPQNLVDDIPISNVAAVSSTTPAITASQPEFIATAAPKTSTSFSALNFGALGAALSQVTTTATTATVQSSEAPIALTVKPADSTDNLFGNLNICSPTTQDNGLAKTTVPNMFGGSLFESTAFTNAASSANSKPLFGSPSSSAPLFGSVAATTASPSLISASTTPTPAIASMSTPLPITANTATVSSSAAFGPSSTSPSTSTATSSSANWGIGTGKSVFGANVATTTVSIFGGTTTSSGFGGTTTTSPVFGGTTPTSTVFGGQTTAAPFAPAATTAAPFSPATTTAAPFASSATTAAPLFGTVTPNTSVSPFAGGSPSLSSAPLFGTANTFSNVSSGSSIFAGTPTVASSGNIFGGIPKPDQSVFAATSSASTSPFAAGNATGTALFCSPTSAQASSGDNIFGSASTGTVGFGNQPGTTASSIFGGAPSVSQPTSLFGGVTTTTNQVESSTNIFGSPTQPNQGGGGSLFGSSTFGGSGQTTGGSIFGGGGATTGPFGGSSTFGQTSPSPFSGATQQQNSSFGGGGFGQSGFVGGGSVFGPQTTGFSSSPPSGSFAQGGPSIAQTGFGSPAAQFAKPTFGGPPTFGSPPAFGATAGFGTAPGFGSPKSAFGGFGTTNTGAFSPPTQKNALFETLGSSDSGLSFGNLAQNANANNSKPQFGGSQFSSWR